MVLPALPPPQVTKYVEREIINHRQLVHPHIIQFKEVRRRCKPERWPGWPAQGGLMHCRGWRQVAFWRRHGLQLEDVAAALGPLCCSCLLWQLLGEQAFHCAFSLRPQGSCRRLWLPRCRSSSRRSI